MLTLQEILERETRVLLDTSSISINSKDNAQAISRKIDSFLQSLAFSNSVYTIKDVVEELMPLRTNLNEGRKELKKGLRKVEKINRYVGFSEIRGKIEEVAKKEQAVKRLISRLKDRILNLTDLANYQPFEDFVFYLEDRLKIKKDGNPSNRTDEKVVSAALFLTVYGFGRTAIATGDSDISKLLRCCADISNNSKFLPQNETLAKALAEKEVIVYFKLPGTQDYEPRFNSRMYASKPQRWALTPQDLEFIKEKLTHFPQPVLSPFS